MATEPPSSWSRAQRVLHWTMAALVLLAVPMGIIMVGLPLRDLLLKFVLYQLHKTLGIAVFLLALTQLALHRRRGRPAWDSSLSERQMRAASAVHAALFFLLVATPMAGYLTAATAPAKIPTLFLGVIPVPHLVGTNPAWFGVLRQVHFGLAILLALLACGHALMALRHHRQGKDTLLRMWRGRPA